MALPGFVQDWLDRSGFTFVKPLSISLLPGKKGSFPCIVVEADRDALDFYALSVSPDGDTDRLSSLRVFRNKESQWQVDDRNKNLAIYTTPDHRRKGIARALWEAAVEQLGHIERSSDETVAGASFFDAVLDPEAVVGPTDFQSIPASLVLDNFILSASAQELWDQYYSDISPEMFQRLIGLDPTTVYKDGWNPTKMTFGRYTKKILQWYGDLLIDPMFVTRVVEGTSANEFSEALEEYDKVRTKLPVDRRDINKFKSPADLVNFMKTGFEDLKAELATKDSDILYEDATWLVLTPLTHSASCYFGRGSEWCTSREYNSNYYNQYSGDGTLYMCLNKKDRKHSYQFFISSTPTRNFELRDWDDEEVSQEEVIKRGDASLFDIEAVIKALPMDFSTPAVYEYSINTSMWESTTMGMAVVRVMAIRDTLKNGAYYDQRQLGKFWVNTGDFSWEWTDFRDTVPQELKDRVGLIFIVASNDMDEKEIGINVLTKIIHEAEEEHPPLDPEITVNPNGLIKSVEVTHALYHPSGSSVDLVGIFFESGSDDALVDDPIVDVILSAANKVSKGKFTPGRDSGEIQIFRREISRYHALFYETDLADDSLRTFLSSQEIGA